MSAVYFGRVISQFSAQTDCEMKFPLIFPLKSFPYFVLPGIFLALSTAETRHPSRFFPHGVLRILFQQTFIHSFRSRSIATTALHHNNIPYIQLQLQELSLKITTTKRMNRKLLLFGCLIGLVAIATAQTLPLGTNVDTNGSVGGTAGEGGNNVSLVCKDVFGEVPSQFNGTDEY